MNLTPEQLTDIFDNAVNKSHHVNLRFARVDAMRLVLEKVRAQQVTLVMTVGENETTYVFSSFLAAQAWLAKHPQPHIITTRVVDHPETVTAVAQ